MSLTALAGEGSERTTHRHRCARDMSPYYTQDQVVVMLRENRKGHPMTSENKKNETEIIPVPLEEIGYTNTIFVQSLFPYRATDEYRRVLGQGSNQVTLMSPNGLPYGKYPRLIMAYIITTVLQRAYQYQRGQIGLDEARVIPLGESLTEFFHAMGVNARATGGKSGSGTRLKEQLRRLVSSTITVEQRIKTARVESSEGQNQSIAESWEFWGNTDTGEITSGKLTVSKHFFYMLCDRPIPIHLPTLQRIKKPRAIDLYVWTTLKQYWLARQNKQTYTFSWREVEHQFSVLELTTSVQRRNFRNEIKSCIEEVSSLWPDSGLEADTELGVTITSTRPHVPIKRPKLSLVKPS